MIAIGVRDAPGRGMGPRRRGRARHVRHALDLSEELELTEEQRKEIDRFFRAMNLRARDLGARLVERERELDRGFRERRVTEAELEELTREIALLEGELRFVHLEAHLRTTALLTPGQSRRYREARGYGEPPGDPSEGSGRGGNRRDLGRC